MNHKEDLEKALEKYKGNVGYLNGEPDYHLVGRLNDKLLLELKQLMIDDPSKENIITFINTLDKYYSSGLKFIPKSVFHISEYVLVNWRGKLNLEKIAVDKMFDAEKNLLVVEKMREEIATLLRPHSAKSVNLFSFVTKFFHQLQNTYPIWDDNVRKYFNLCYPEIIEYPHKYNYPDYYNVIKEIAGNIGWPMAEYNDLDNAAWVLGDELKRKEKAAKNE